MTHLTTASLLVVSDESQAHKETTQLAHSDVDLTTDEREHTPPPLFRDLKDVPPPKFSVPDHPSVRLLEARQTEKSGSPPLPPYQLRDPHQQPEFTQESIVNPAHPILYLPPLISALPSVPGVPSPGQDEGASDDEEHSSQSSDPESDTDSDTSTIIASSSSSPSLIDVPKVLTTETRLPYIDPVSLSLHRALHYFRPLNDKYASRAYGEAFNWDELRLPEDEEREWYCVAFRSRRKEGSNGDGELPPPPSVKH
jgi:hypothetical protein